MLSKLPTRHSIKLKEGLYLRLEEFFRKSVVPKPLKPKEIEKQMNDLFSKFVEDFLQSQQQAAAMYNTTVLGTIRQPNEDPLFCCDKAAEMKKR